jgi:hypothetical protein
MTPPSRRSDLVPVITGASRGLGASLATTFAAEAAPGVVDTDMQALVRSTPVGDLPAGDRFRRLHREEGLNSPEWVARFILDRLVGGTADTGQSDDGTSDTRGPRSVPGA